MAPSEEPPTTSAELIKLMTRIENRKWRDETLSRLQVVLEDQHSELDFIKHVLNGCGQCLMELSIAIERYGGRNCPWYLNLEYEVGWYPDVYEEDPLYKDAPRIDKYRIGSYWTGTSKDTIRFIKDRMKWAQAKIRRNIEALVDYYVEVENWDLESPLPEEPYLCPTVFGVDDWRSPWKPTRE